MDTIRKARIKEHLLMLSELVRATDQRLMADQSDPARPIFSMQPIRLIGDPHRRD